jgi:hypothetical protein
MVVSYPPLSLSFSVHAFDTTIGRLIRGTSQRPIGYGTHWAHGLNPIFELGIHITTHPHKCFVSRCLPQQRPAPNPPGTTTQPILRTRDASSQSQRATHLQMNYHPAHITYARRFLAVSKSNTFADERPDIDATPVTVLLETATLLRYSLPPTSNSPMLANSMQHIPRLCHDTANMGTRFTP